MASVFDVTAYILKKTGPISTMKLQKLTYYAQAWSLVWDQMPLFPERFEAWANGPVCPALYNAHRGEFLITGERNGDLKKLSSDAKDTVKAVLQTYGNRRQIDLVLSLTRKRLGLRRVRALGKENEAIAL